MENIKTTIEVTGEGRIDKYIADNSDFSRTDIKRLIEGGAVFCNDIAVRKANFKVREGAKVLITSIIQKEINAKPEDIPINVIYEDDDIIIINKKSGMVVHPAPGHPGGTLVNALLHHFKDLSDINGEIRPGIVHRIDKDTSGLLVVAKNNDAHRFLASEIKEHKVERIYLAWTEGRIENKVLHLDLPIGRDPRHRQKMAVQHNHSKLAKTHVFVEKVLENKTLVRCELETGRTHQIRVHLAYIKHAIIGDPIYGKRIDDFGQRLHAYKLKLIHPTTKKEMEFEAPIPEEFNI
ncbi:MAG: RluA family pseudouridine synthase [Mycoplasmataceae bacterium]|nr:RluA family pseudouridine synthase [Mycoplasmataceae bacterium]